MPNLTDYSNVYRMGRWHQKDVDGINTLISLSGGSRLSFSVAGTTSLAIKTKPIDNSGYGGYSSFEYRINGGAWVRTPAIATTDPYVLSSALDAGAVNTAEIIGISNYASDAWGLHTGNIVQGFAVDDGGSIGVWKPASAGKVQIIADSIGEGQVAIQIGGTQVALSSDPRTAVYTEICRLHNMEPHAWAFGGSGLTRFEPLRYIPVTNDNYGYKMAGVPANDDPAFDWVMIALGTNDGAATSGDFRTAYATLIATIKQQQPQATIYCFGSSPFYGSNRSADIEYVAGVEGVTFLSTAGWTARTSYIHPLSAQALLIAADMAPLFGEQPTTTTTTTSAPGTTTTAAPLSEHPLRLEQTIGGALRYKNGPNIYQIALTGGVNAPIRVTTSGGVKRLG